MFGATPSTVPTGVILNWTITKNAQYRKEIKMQMISFNEMYWKCLQQNVGHLCASLSVLNIISMDSVLWKSPPFNGSWNKCCGTSIDLFELRFLWFNEMVLKYSTYFFLLSRQFIVSVGTLASMGSIRDMHENSLAPLGAAFLSKPRVTYF